MANEPSWEDIFNPNPPAPQPAKPAEERAAEPAVPPLIEPAPRPPVRPLVEPVTPPPAEPVDPESAPDEQYPPTRAFPAVAPEVYLAAEFAAESAARSVPPAPQPDPFAGLFPSQPEPTPTPTPAAGPEQTPEPEPEPDPEPDPFAELFASQPEPTYETEPVAPLSRREARESGGRRGGSGGRGTGGNGPGKPRKKRRLLWLKITLPIVLVLGAAGGVFAYGWFTYNEQVREVLGIPLPTDYESEGNGEEAIVTIRSGDIGSDVAVTLHDAGVTMTYDAVYDYLVENPDIGFTPGNWRLEQEMSAQSAVEALQDTANKVTDKLLLREGISLATALEVIAETTGLALEDVQAAAEDPTVYGLPENAPTLEGFLFPATYELDGSEDAQQILQMLVDTMYQHLDDAGVAVDDRYNTVIMASIIQREAGQNQDDFYKISRVFANRIEQDVNLESDATVAYGTGRFDSVWTERAEREDPSNLYNTYANPGLPIGPIGLPGDVAIDAALHPADGPWLYFVPINLATGETMFSETFEEHDAYVDQLLEWCEASDENATYCE